ncbi:MAG: hypothetical protein JSR39_09025 [Verrucomicrobia bacterium]|nr:hypothetical protein [Verrucomicrobiota bacterium]
MDKIWEEKAVGELVAMLHPAGDVLEIHFTSGIAAKLIQELRPKSHTIIEPDQALAKRAASDPKATVIQKPWQEGLHQLGTFDAILLGRDLRDVQCSVSKEHHGLATMALGKEKQLHQLIEKQLPELSQIKYSDEDLEAFCLQMEQGHRKDLPRFLHQLKQKGQITEAQYEKVHAAHRLPKEASAPIPVRIDQSSDLIFKVLSVCLDKHMRKGSRFVCFLNESNYENPSFFDGVITNPFVNYQEKWIKAASSAGAEEAVLAMVVEKQG